MLTREDSNPYFPLRGRAFLYTTVASRFNVSPRDGGLAVRIPGVTGSPYPVSTGVAAL